MTKRLFTARGFNITLYACGHVESRDKLKHLHSRKAYGHKIYHGDNILQGASTHKFA